MAAFYRENLATPGFYHVYNRGVNREIIFRSNDDYDFLMGLIPQLLDKNGVRLHSHTLMPNHFHFILEQSRPNMISAFMKTLSETFARRVNLVYHRVGHVFQGRFKRKYVDKDEYLLTLARYIDLNPVHSRLVASPEEWRFGSSRAFLTKESNSFVHTEKILGLVGGREAYSRFLAKPPEALGTTVEYLLIDREVL